MTVPRPKVVDLDYDEIVRRTERLARELSGWRAPDDGELDPGAALVRLFAGFAEHVADRLNRAPDKNFLAFLDLIGRRIEPPQPARTPLTFVLAEGSPVDAFVPAGTRAAAPAESDEEEVVFETERELVATAASLTEVYVREPDRDRFADRTVAASTADDPAFPPFEGDTPVEHSLYIGHDDIVTMENPKRLELSLETRDAARLAALPIAWEVWDGSAWLATDPPQSSARGAKWTVAFADPPIPAPVEVGGETAAWIRARLSTPLPPGDAPVLGPGDPQALFRGGLAPDGVVVGSESLGPDAPFHPFGPHEEQQDFFLRIDEPFMRAAADVELAVELDAPGQGSTDLVLLWQFWNGKKWQILGRSSPEQENAGGQSLSLFDRTRALSSGGRVSFRSPDTWRPTTVGNLEGYWLRVSVEHGNYGIGEALRPPRIASLVASYAWELPRLDKVAVEAQVVRQDLQPEKLFTNATEIDPAKDFYPFGEQPRFNDTLYIGPHEAFSMGSGTISLSVELSSPPPIKVNASRDLELIWEARSGDRWVQVGRSSPRSSQVGPTPTGRPFDDHTLAFTRPGKIDFQLPAEVSEATVNGQTGYWVRVRIIKGDYGKEATYVKKGSGDSERYELVPATFGPPSIAELLITYGHAPRGAARRCLRVSDFGAVEMTPGFAPFVPMRDAHPALYVGFDRPFANRAVTLFSNVERALYTGEESRPGGESRHKPQRVTWEYSGPNGWTALGAQDETAGFTLRGTTSFLGPADFAARTEFGRERHWIRARLRSGEAGVASELRSILLNTTWAIQATTVGDEIVGSGTGKPDLRLSLASAPVLPGETIEVREVGAPSDAGAEEALESWVRWSPVADFHTSGPGDRHYLLDHVTGIVRFGDGKRGAAPPLGLNNIRAGYRTGGGVRGNLPAASVVELKSAVPYIDSVVQPAPAQGGSDAETLDQVRERGPRLLRHRNRAVTFQDYEDLAHQSSPDVARARAIPARQPSEGGRIGLVIVPRSGGDRPDPSLGLVRRVEEYVRGRAAPAVDLWVAGPDWVRVDVSADLVPESLEGLEAVEIEAHAALRRFLHPLTGGFDGRGRPFGRPPHLSDLYVLLESISGVDHVDRLSLEQDPPEPRPDRFLTYSGSHVVNLIAGEAD